MICLWKNPVNCPDRLYGKYDRTRSPNYLLLSKGRRLNENEFRPLPVVIFKGTKEEMLRFDNLPNSARKPLVNNRIRTLLRNFAPEDVQFLPARVICKDGELEDYQFLNATNAIVGIDHEKSIYTKMKNANAILHARFITYKPGCMGEHKLARDKERLSQLLVSEEIKQVFEHQLITGVRLVTPEEYYQSLYGPVE